MPAVRPAIADQVNAIEDSRRWKGFTHRPDDIFISTPPKSGTTWMQGILSSLLWPHGDAPGDLFNRSPWIDMRFAPVDEALALVESQAHRRFLKTHSPADCVPLFEECRYVTVYRDGRDALLSWANHRAVMRPELVAHLNRTAAAEGIAPLDEGWSGDMDELFDEWAGSRSPARHLASWWPMRHEPFVLFVHYNDCKADLAGEMRRIAEFCGIEVPEDVWEEVVARCSLERMRDDPVATTSIELAFEGGASAFFHKGTNGRWRDVLTAEQLARWDAIVAETLDADAAAWLASGSIDIGWRPDAVV